MRILEKSLGELVGGAALVVLGGGGSIGGFTISATGVGAAVGVPAMVVSVGLVIAGVANAAAGLAGLQQALSMGGGGGAGGGPVHHIMTNKNRVSTASGGPWTPRFENMANRAGMTLEDAANKVAILGHQGPHPQAYHEAIFKRLRNATDGLSGGAFSSAFRAELDAIRAEVVTSGSVLNKLLTGQ